MGFIRQSFKRQIFVVFMVVTLILVFLSGALTIQGFQARIHADYEKTDQEQDSEINNKILALLEESEKAMEGISKSDKLERSFKATRRNSLEIYIALYEETKEINNYCSVGLYMNGECLYTTKSSFSGRALPENFSILYEAKKNPGKTIYALDSGEKSGLEPALFMAREVFDGEKKGIVVFRFEKEELSDLLSGSINAKDGFMLTNEYLRPFLLLGTAENGKDLAAIRSNLMNGRLYNEDISSNVYITELGETGILSIYITPPALEKSAVKAGYQIIFLLAIISVFVCLLVASRLSEYISKPINTLAVAMKRFRHGDFDTQIELSREDEFQQLAVGFNKMTTRLKSNIKERVESERKVNETRIAMMQAQLNPHFLYNTLDTIKWVAKANQVPEIATLSTSLANILRTSISENQFCRLSHELKLVEDYCDIQKIRFDDSFDIAVTVPKELEDAIIPKLILQPLVENAIIHGFEDKRDGHIDITVKEIDNFTKIDESKEVRNEEIKAEEIERKKEREIEREIERGKEGNSLLEITITDNGAGISDEMIEALIDDDPETLKGHLGLNNVNTIIRIYYGKEYGVSARRPEEGGTIMKVILPLSFKEPERKIV